MVAAATSGKAPFRRYRNTHLSILRLPGDETARPGRWCRGGHHCDTARRTFFLRCFQSLEHLVGRDGSLINAYANGIKDSIDDGRNDRVQWPLPGFLSAKWPFTVRHLHQDSFNFGRVKGGGKFVIQQGWYLVSPLAEDLLFHHGFAVAHIRAPLDLACHEQGIDGLPYIMRKPEFFNYQLSCLHIDCHLRHTCRVGVGWRRSNPGSLIVTVNTFGWSIRASR